MLATHLKHFFVPHEGNNYKPHLLHTKRAIFYSVVFAGMKAILIVFALLVPAEVFLVPDVLGEQVKQIVDATNKLRAEKGLPRLTSAPKLYTSADARAGDMAERNYFSHVGPSGHTLGYFLKSVGYKYRVAGENLAMGFSDADSVVNAWIKSPTHYSNLIDNDYSQIGVGVVAGYFNGQPTVFVAQHFGDPAQTALLPPAMISDNALADANSGSTPVQRVASVKLVETTSSLDFDTVPQALAIDQRLSAVYWADVGGSTKFDVRAYLSGNIQSAIVLVQNFPIELHAMGNGLYGGTLTVDIPSDQFFNPIITPSITIYGTDGSLVQDSIDWYDVKIVGKTPLQKYLQAKQYLRPITNLFSISTGIYWGFLVLFTIALVINIVVEVRQQHYHIIAQTLLVIAFLGWLLWT